MVRLSTPFQSPPRALWPRSPPGNTRLARPSDPGIIHWSKKPVSTSRRNTPLPRLTKARRRMGSKLAKSHQPSVMGMRLMTLVARTLFGSRDTGSMSLGRSRQHNKPRCLKNIPERLVFARKRYCHRDNACHTGKRRTHARTNSVTSRSSSSRSAMRNITANAWPRMARSWAKWRPGFSTRRNSARRLDRRRRHGGQ